jgi:hypothetical protein
MSGYRVYVIGLDGHFINAIHLDCADDKAAIESAKQFIDGYDIELWQLQLNRQVAKFDGVRPPQKGGDCSVLTMLVSNAPPWTACA